jgi:hypothetical protein
MIQDLKNSSVKVFENLTTTPLHRTGTRILQVMVGLILLYRLFTEIPFAGYLFGSQGVSDGSAVRMFGSAMGGFFDLLFQTSGGAYLVLIGIAVGALGLITGTWIRASTMLAMICFALIGLRAPTLGDGGDNITQIVLIYMMFLLPPTSQPKPGTKVWLHNMAFAAIALQLIIMYFVTGTSKVMGNMWTNGTAMYYIAQVEWFSTPFFSNFFKSDFFAPLAAFSTMFYQLAFPFVVFSRYKLLLFAVGISFHLGILLMMGLVTFSTAMIALELFLITDAEYRMIFKFLAHLNIRLPKFGRKQVLTESV